MEITQIVALRGPNRYSLDPVLEVILDTNHPGSGSYILARQVARATLTYQQRAGAKVSFRAALPGSYPGVYRIAIGYRNEEQARAALKLAVRVVSGANINMKEEMAKLHQIQPGAADHEAEQARNSGKLIVAVTGTNGKTTVVRLIAQIMRDVGRVVGWTSTEGSWVGERQLDSGDNSGPQSARLVLRQPDVEVAVLETARGGILREGLAFNQADVGVVTNVSADHVGLRGVDTVEEMARVKRVVVDAVKPGGTAVLNADNHYTVAMAEHLPNGAQLIFFGLDKANPTLVAHIAGGGTAAYLDGERLLLAHDGAIQQITHLAHLPISMNGLAAYQVANSLAAAAATWAVGVPLSAIAVTLRSFHTDLKHSGGRFNMFRLNDGLVILDYVHNQAAVEAIGAVIDALPAQRRIAVPMSAGDRRDQDIMDYGSELGKHFDYFVLKETRHRRGRRPGEMAGLIEQGVHSVDALRPHIIETIADYDQANSHALDLVGPGDLLLISDDEFDQVVRQIKHRGGATLSERDLQLPPLRALPPTPPAISPSLATPAISTPIATPAISPPLATIAAKRGPGRPPKPRTDGAELASQPAAKRGRGRPPKLPAPVSKVVPAPLIERDMAISEVVTLAAPNRHGDIPVLEARLDTGLTGQASERRAWDVVGKAIVYQQSAGLAVGFKSVLPTDSDGVYHIAVAYHSEAVARAALQMALRSVGGAQFDFASEIKQLREMTSLAAHPHPKQFEQPDDQGSVEQRGQEVGDGQLFDVEQLEAHTQHDQPAYSGHFVDLHATKQVRSRNRRCHADAALHHEDGANGEKHAVAQAGREGECSKAIQRRFERQDLDVVAGQSILDRAKNSERANAEDQAGGDKRLANSGVTALQGFALCHAVVLPHPLHYSRLDTIAQLIQPLLQGKEFAGECAQHQATQGDQWVASLQHHLGGEQQGGQAERLQDDALVALRQAVAQQRANHAADKHSRHVE